ncbi:alpha/beta hydrolase [Lysobacter capsici]|uniref:alpha/beta hydrolase n=1 Tax=Lysobacter capsici TaxID=435897 RepID=UPI0017838117|nr:carboxylesterase [Lysobacter capsici]UOF14308.1 alpha/beta hydrolase [Lysobacter capsici]
METSPAASPELLDAVIRETGPTPAWSVLWLHGLGDSGDGFAPIVPELLRPDWPALRFVFPHAPVRAVTINNGMRMRAWYDIRDFSDLANRADETGVEESVRQVEALIGREIERGIPTSRILLAGFSQGGAITLATALQRKQPLGGLIALSTYLPMADRLIREATAVAHTQPMFMAHGQHDPVVPYRGGEMAAARLRTLGFKIDWHAYPMAHQVCAEEIDALGDWMSQRFAAQR